MNDQKRNGLVQDSMYWLLTEMIVGVMIELTTCIDLIVCDVYVELSRLEWGY